MHSCKYIPHIYERISYLYTILCIYLGSSFPNFSLYSIGISYCKKEGYRYTRYKVGIRWAWLVFEQGEKQTSPTLLPYSQHANAPSADELIERIPARGGIPTCTYRITYQDVCKKIRAVWVSAVKKDTRVDTLRNTYYVLPACTVYAVVVVLSINQEPNTVHIDTRCL